MRRPLLVVLFFSQLDCGVEKDTDAPDAGHAGHDAGPVVEGETHREMRIEWIQSGEDGTCLTRPLVLTNGIPHETREHVDCMVRETPVAGGACGPGRYPAGTEDGRTVCGICQLGDGDGEYRRDAAGNDVGACAGTMQYWFYTTEDPSCAGLGKIELTNGAIPEDGSSVLALCVSR